MLYRKASSVRPTIRPRRGLGLITAALLILGLAVPVALAAPGAQADAEPVRIGYLGAANSPMALGAQLAVEQINAAGGFVGPGNITYEFELIPRPTAPTPDTLATELDKLLQQDVVAILGPQDNDLLVDAANVQALVQGGVPILTAAPLDALTDSDLTDIIFRIRAPERVYSYALATYMVEDLGLNTISLVQTDVQVEGLQDFADTLESLGVAPFGETVIIDPDDLEDQVEELVDLDPEAIAMWGHEADAYDLLSELRRAGWDGRFAYHQAAEAAQVNVLPTPLPAGVLGANSWIYSDPSRASQIFLRDYVVTFGAIPTPEAAAAYDAIWYLRTAIINQGPEPDALQDALIGGNPLSLVQGVLHPSDFENGDLARIAVVYELGRFGGPEVVARFDDTQRLPLEGGEPVADAGTPPPTPTLGPPTITPFPTATREGAWATVTANVLNVRTGPGFNYDQIGQVQGGELLRILGTNPDFTWLAVDFRGATAWVRTEYTEISGNLGLVPIIQPPASPTPAATFTPTLPSQPDIVIDTVVLSPAQPVPNQPFTATITVRNAGGGAAGQFAVAATWEPGSVYTATIVNGLAGGQSTQVQLNATIIGTGVFQVAVIGDLNNDVAELNENNNNYNITYRADYPTFVQQTSVQLVANTPWDLYGGTIDFLWDGYNVAMQNGSVMGILTGVTYDTVHYDLLSPAVINNTIGIGTDRANPGVLIGMYTAEGHRAVMRIDNRQDTTIWISYRVYNH